MSDRILPATLADYRPSGRTYQSTDGRFYVFFGIDSDGCVDDGMRYKHGGPFPRAVIETFELEPVAEYVRVAWTFVNEFEDRGCPRFTALVKFSDRLAEMPVVQGLVRSGVVKVPKFPYLRGYLEAIAKFDDEALKGYIATLADGPEKDELHQVTHFSRKVNEYVESDCPNIPHFPHAKGAIERAYEMGVDQMIVSGTPEAHLRREWEHHGLIDKVLGVYGRDSGKKADHLTSAIQASRRNGTPYSIPIMFGDAPGDDVERMKAGRNVRQRIGFMPIRVGFEDYDWEWFLDNFLGPGKVHEYTEDVEGERVAAFYDNLDRKWNPEADLTRLFVPKKMLRI